MTTYLNKEFAAADYAKFRPQYPKRLYDYVVDYHKRNNDDEPIRVAVDLACGTGQATQELAKYADKVIALDHSETMADQARKEVKASNVEFGVAGDLDLCKKVGEKSLDLLVTAEAAHYFHWPEFWDEAANALKPKGTLAIWAYWTFAFPDHPVVAKIIDDFAYNDDKCGPFWDSGRSHLNKEYIDIVNLLPQDKFEKVEYRVNHFDKLRPEEPFELVKKDLEVGGIISMLKTWSPYFNYKRAHPDKPDIADAVMDKITEVTGLTKDSKVTVKWNTVYILATRRGSNCKCNNQCNCSKCHCSKCQCTR